MASGEGRSLRWCPPLHPLRFAKRHMMKRIARDKPGNLGTDTSRDYVYTEWDGVTRFAEDFLTATSLPERHDKQLAHRRRQLLPIRPEEWRWMAHRQLPGGPPGS